VILLIDTSGNEKFTIALCRSDGSLLFRKNIEAQMTQAEKLLPAIDKLLKQQSKKLRDIKGIIVVIGPGGFTSLRIGVITANTFSYILSIPVAGFKLGEFTDLDNLAKKGAYRLKTAKPGMIIEPYYGREPNITQSKKKIWQ